MLFIDRQGEAASALGCALAGEDCTARLEASISTLTGKQSVAVCSTDAALHTALHLCGVTRGDYVLVPSFTFYSYVATIVHAGGVPVFLDCDPNTRCVSPLALETALVWSQLQSKPPKAVVVDNAFGAVADYNVLSPVCKAWNVPLIELCCDALLAEYNGKICGGNGDYGVIGFNKRLPGGGGVLVCDDKSAALGFVRGAYSEYENHDYRLNNFIAALDCAQLTVVKQLVTRARKNVAALCAKLNCIVPPTNGDAANFAVIKAAHLTTTLRDAGYEVKRPPPVHTLPQYCDCFFFEHEQGYSVCTSLSDCCLVGMDISALARNRLIRILKRNCADG